MNSLHQNDIYYDSASARSPRANPYQTQSLPRQSSRHFDNYSTHPIPQPQNGHYMDELVSRYEAPRFDDRMNTGLQNTYSQYDMNIPQAWNSTNYSQSSNLAAVGTNPRGKMGNNRSARGALPATWLDQPTQQTLGVANFSTLVNNSMGPPARPEQLTLDTDEDLIPTAIVIKNIPFAVKKEQLVQVMTDLCLPLPYAFNYHFDNGVFRGLAFANFTTAEETATVIQAMNHLDLQGRKLRVEYKKMLPQAERDRIEREKRERRGQLEEQHRPIAPSQLQNQSSMSSLASHMQNKSPSPNGGSSMHPNIDMNDPLTLSYYSKLILFQGDQSQGEVLTFPPQLPPNHRKIIHGLAHSLKMAHISHGQGEQRQIHVYKSSSNASTMSPTVTSGGNPLDPNRRGLYRAATTDFSDVRDSSLYGPLARQSSGYLSFNDATGSLSAGSNLRTAKSFADLRSYTPSPAQSASSFPVGHTVTTGRGQEYTQQNSPGSSRSNVTPITANPMNANAEAAIVNGLGTMNLNSGFGPSAGSPHRLRGMMSWDREVPGPIGGHRNISGNNEDVSRNRNQGAPARQPRGPLPERGNGFNRPRQNGHQNRGSDDLSSQGVDLSVE